MFNKLVEKLTGMDDLERVAAKGDPVALFDYMKTRQVWIPQKPTRFLDAADFSEKELLALIENESQELAKKSVHLWVLDMDGKKHLPVFSNRDRAQEFSAAISKNLNKVFGLGCIQAMLPDVLHQVQADVIAVNVFSKKYWVFEIERLTRH